MRLRKLGKTDVTISALGFGAGGFWGMPYFDEAAARAIVDVALEEGVTIFDTGPNYSNGNAEARLGRILGRRANDLFIGTKVGSLFANGRNYHDYSAISMKRSFEESLRRLGRDHVDLLQFHGVPEPFTQLSIDFLVEQKRLGRTRLIGVSAGPDDVELALASGVFDVMMLPYNVIERHKEAKMLELCGKAGVGVLVKSPLAQTLYSNRIFNVRSLADLWYLARAAKNFRGKIFEGRKYRFLMEGGEGHDLALQFVLDNPHVSAAIVGTTRAGNLQRNCRASRSPLPDVVRERILAVK